MQRFKSLMDACITGTGLVEVNGIQCTAFSLRVGRAAGFGDADLGWIRVVNNKISSGIVDAGQMSFKQRNENILQSIRVGRATDAERCRFCNIEDRWR
jgi:hypothetical protein